MDFVNIYVKRRLYPRPKGRGFTRQSDKTGLRFDETKSNNPFAYLTTVIIGAFTVALCKYKKEQKALNITFNVQKCNQFGLPI